MKTPSTLATLIRTLPIPEKVDQKTISHSQFTIYNSCPYQWKLRYVDKIRPFSSTIHTVFGTAVHETLQEYLRILYEQSVKASDEFKLKSYFYDRLFENYKMEMDKNEGQHFSTKEEIEEFAQDGYAILGYFKTHRETYFKIGGYELLGIEIHVMQPTSNPNVWFDGYIDIILYDRDDDRVIIFDFKTSGRGWKDKQTKDEAKIAQILWYKKFLAQQYEIPQAHIEVIYMVLKRKLWENSQFPQSRVQVLRPAHGSQKMDKASYLLDQFVSECFTENGEYNLDREFRKNPGDACKFCPFKDDIELCDKRN